MTLKEIRISRLMNQKDFADYVGVSSNTISRIELGKTFMSVGTLKKIAEKLGLSEAERISLYNSSTENT